MTVTLLSLLMDFPGTNCISGPAVGTRRLVGSTLNELILDVRGSQLINYLQGRALSCAFPVSSSMARAQDPAIDQTQSQAKAFAQSAAWGLCQPRVSPPCHSNSRDSVGGQEGTALLGAAPSPDGWVCSPPRAPHPTLPLFIWSFPFCQGINYCSKSAFIQPKLFYTEQNL